MSRRSRRRDAIAGHRVRLPEDVRSPFEVYLNGVRQELGTDYQVRRGELVFGRELVREKLGIGAWVIGSIGIGTYERNDQVDVRYEAAGQPKVAQSLPIIPDSG